LKQRLKLCSNLLIKKKRIIQLINRKLNENRYNNKTNIKSFNQQHNPQALSTYNDKQTVLSEERKPVTVTPAAGSPHGFTSMFPELRGNILFGPHTAAHLDILESGTSADPCRGEQ
jgi:hypothetical protein